MQIVRPVEAMHALALSWRRQGKQVGFVPTMGFLHRGHTTLIELMRRRCDILVVSIYVNPLQFAPIIFPDSFAWDDPLAKKGMRQLLTPMPDCVLVGVSDTEINDLHALLDGTALGPVYLDKKIGRERF